MASFFFQSGEQVDADDSLVVSRQQSASVASHPIESGSQLGDHVSPEPERVTLDLIFTPQAAGRERVFPPPGETRPDTAVTRLMTAARNGEVLKSVIFANEWWDEVAILSARPNRAFQDGDSRPLQVELQRLRVAEARTVAVERVRRTKRRPSTAVKPKANLMEVGAQPTTPVGVFEDQLGLELFKISRAVDLATPDSSPFPGGGTSDW